MMADDKKKTAAEPEKSESVTLEKMTAPPSEPEPKTTPEVGKDSEVSAEPKFSGREIVRGTSGSDGDILFILLDPKKMYTEKEFTTILEDFKKEEVHPKKEKEE